MKAITLDHVKHPAEIVKKTKAGELVESKVNSEVPENTECLRAFNVFVDDACFEAGVDEVGGGTRWAVRQ